jgi:hypothetical protein
MVKFIGFLLSRAEQKDFREVVNNLSGLELENEVEVYHKEKLKNLNIPVVSGSALLAAFDVCFTMREWCGNVIAGADKEDDTTKDKEMLDKCNAFIGWFKEHYR